MSASACPRIEMIEAGSFETVDTNEDLERSSNDGGALTKRGAFADVSGAEKSRVRTHVVQLIEPNLKFPIERAEGFAERSTVLCVPKSGM